MQYFYRVVLQLECLTYLPKMNLFPWTAFLPEGFENGIIQKVLDRRLYGVGQHFTFWRFSRKWKFFGNFDCDFRKCFTKGFFLTENEVFRNFSFDGEFSIFYRQPLLSYQTVASRCLPEQSFHGVIKTFILLSGKNKLELLPFSLYSEMFNRRAAALKPSLFLKGVFVIFLHPPPPPFPTSKHSWNLNSQIFVCVLWKWRLKN